MRVTQRAVQKLLAASVVVIHVTQAATVAQTTRMYVYLQLCL